jgi:hypothetical protein
VEKFFDSWLQSRGGSDDAETVNAISNLRNYLEKHSETKFVTLHRDEALDPNFKFPNDFIGYKWKVDADWYYLILGPYFNEIFCKNIKPAYLITELEKRGYMAFNTNGKLMETKHIPRRGNVRGYILNSKILENKEDVICF